MKPKILVTLIVLALTGCVTGPKNKSAWEPKPLLDIRHGMADGAAYYVQGRAKEGQGDLAAAEEFYGKALAADPKSVDALNALGALYARRGETERAAETYRRIAELSPQRPYLYNNMGYALYLQGRYGEAVDALRHAVTIAPGYERAWINLEAAARKGGMTEVAALAARRSLEPSARPAGDGFQPEAVAKAPDPAPAGRGITLADAARQRVIRLVEVPPRLVPNDGMVKLGEPLAVDLGKAAAKPAALVPLPAMPERQATRSARIEVSNGSGIRRHALGMVEQLKGKGVGIARITNVTPFNVRQTYIEYRPGFADAARALKERVGAQVALVEAKDDRPGTDLRLVLGSDRVTMPARIVGRASSRQTPAG